MEILKLKPVFKDYIWGGQRLRTDFGFESELDKLAEGWMLACHKDGMNVIENGAYSGKTLEQAIQAAGKEALCGTNAQDYPYFPVLIKLIDAKDNLSIQVHPDNAYAQRVEGEYGKTEMWYVLDADEEATLIYGFKEKISKKAFQEAIEKDTLPEVLNTVHVQKGDMFFIEAGTVHAIGKGALIAEIQQNSNTTYRVYDYGRLGADGKPRQLHIEKALAVSKTEPARYDTKPQGGKEQFADYTKQLLVSCKLFTVNHFEIQKNVTLFADRTSFQHVLVIDGSGTIDSLPLKKGDSFFVPADYGEYTIKGRCEILVTNI